MKNYEALPVFDKLKQKIYAYYETIWKDKREEGVDKIDRWLENFKNEDADLLYKEHLNMLYLLSKFMYFGNQELRVLLLSLYRDLFKYPLVENIRKSSNDTQDINLIENQFLQEREKTRFLGVGNPSESGVHLLYYFRQECKLSKKYFINTSDIFKTLKVTEELPGSASRTYLKSEINDKKIKRYIFIDDFCGSGSQAKMYLKQIVENIKFENNAIEVNYFTLFGTESGICNVRNLSVFNRVESVFTLDETFMAFSDSSRYYKQIPPSDGIIDKEFSKSVAIEYGKNLFDPPLGYGNCQLLLGFFHNTPDNSLPIFWSDENNWKSIFFRYNKIY